MVASLDGSAQDRKREAETAEEALCLHLVKLLDVTFIPQSENGPDAPGTHASEVKVQSKVDCCMRVGSKPRSRTSSFESTSTLFQWVGLKNDSYPSRLGT
eukprot:1055731-Prorocentrum_minimum.AAC.1